MNYLKELTIKGKKIQFPIYLPDATRAVVRSLDSQDLKNVGIQAMVVNTYHLMTEPGTNVLDQVGGVHKFMNWDGVLVSDSGGFQVLSLIYQDKALGKISDNEVVFYKTVGGAKRKYTLTPEKSIQVQFSIGSDVMICLDDCPPLNANDEYLEISVNRTIAWAKRCKEEFHRQIERRKLTNATRPLLFAVIQGGDNKELRARCAKELIEIGFDGFGYGGFPMDRDGNFRRETLAYVASLMPDHLPKFALGVGMPQDILEGFRMGYNFFDCVLPTRDARHKRLYAFTKDPATLDVEKETQVHTFVNIDREKFVKDTSPISEYCDCFTCKNYSKAYVKHLFDIEDFTAGRLSTMHNLRTYTKLIDILRDYVTEKL